MNRQLTLDKKKTKKLIRELNNLLKKYSPAMLHELEYYRSKLLSEIELKDFNSKSIKGNKLI